MSEFGSWQAPASETTNPLNPQASRNVVCRRYGFAHA